MAAATHDLVTRAGRPVRDKTGAASLCFVGNRREPLTRGCLAAQGDALVLLRLATWLTRVARIGPFAALLLAAAPVHAQLRYAIDPRFGSITFTVHHLGLFKSEGQFDRFDADLEIDPAHPERTRIAVDVAAASVDMAWQDAAAMLRSPEFFDADRHPHIRFTSTDISETSPGKFAVHGTLEMRGVAAPLELTATLVRRDADPQRGGTSADFVVSGELSRTAWGMVAERVFISDKVDIAIRARIRLATPPHGG